MRLVRFQYNGTCQVGVLRGDTVVALPLARSMQDFISAGNESLAAARRALDSSGNGLPIASVRLLPPIMPSTILCSGSNYADHIREKANTPLSGKEPEFFLKTADCVVGPDDPILVSESFTRKLDCETELAVVIGQPGRFIPVKDAMAHVFGYTIMNDVTARDLQVRSNPQGFVWYELGRGKAFDCSAPLGPCIVTADEIGDPQSLRIRTYVNRELRQSSSTAQMIFTCAHLIHFFSTNFTLRPGMIISTGTPAGTAWSADEQLGGKWAPGAGEPIVRAKGYLRPADLIECEIEHIGVLRNPVAAFGTAVG